MKTLRCVRPFVPIVFILLWLVFIGNNSVHAQAIDRSVTKTGPTVATNNTPFTYTVTLVLPAGINPAFVLTDTLSVGGVAGGIISWEIFECPVPPCPPNPTGDIPNLSESPITGTIPVSGSQPIQINFLDQGGIVSSAVPISYVILLRATPHFNPNGVITNTITLPPDSNPLNDSASTRTEIGQPPLPPASAVPILRDWGMVIMIMFFGGIAVYFMRRNKKRLNH